MKRIVGAVFLFSALISSADEWKPDPAMTGSFSSSPRERTRAFLAVRADGSVRLSMSDKYGHWEGTIRPKDGTELFVMEVVPVDDGDVPEEEEGPVIISMPGENNDTVPAWESTSEKSGTALKEGSVALLLQFDPIAPAWLEMGYGRDAATIQPRKWYHPISEDGGFRHRQYSSFQDRLVSDAPFPVDDEGDVERRLSGVWSNGEDGFGRESIMLATNRFGLFAGGVSAAPVRWSTIEKNGRHYVEFANPLPDKGGDDRYAILFVADLRRELLVRVSETDTVEHAFASMRDPATVRADGRFYRLSETLPEEWAEKISRLPEQIEAHKNGDR